MPEKYLDKEGLAYLWSKIPKEQVWVGSTEPTGDQSVWIDPSGSETEGLATKAELANKQDKLTAGTNITIDANNVISASGGSDSGSYTLPVASKDTLGGVKIDGKTIQINPYGTIYSVVPVANSIEVGGVKPDNETIQIKTDGTISVNKSQISAHNGLPAGGSYPQILIKNSSTDYDANWSNMSDLLLMAGINFGLWSRTNDLTSSDLYNAKELYIMVVDSNSNRIGQYFNFSKDEYGNDATLGNNFNSTYFYFNGDTNQPYFQYNGSQLELQNYQQLLNIFYKT